MASEWSRLPDFVPLDALSTPCGVGNGMAVSVPLGRVVVSNDCNTLTVFELPPLPLDWSAVGVCGGSDAPGNDHGPPGPSSGLRRLAELGSDRSSSGSEEQGSSDGGGGGGGGGMEFNFGGGSGWSGSLCFTALQPPLLLVAAAGDHAVHLVDVVAGVHRGYLCPPRGLLMWPRAVAASASHVAVTACPPLGQAGDAAVHLFDATSHAHLRAVRAVGPLPMPGAVAAPTTLGGCGAGGGPSGLLAPKPPPTHLQWPTGVRLSADGQHVAVADVELRRVALFRVCDGAFVRYVGVDLWGPMDLEECRGGWLVACGVPQCSVEFVGDGPGEVAGEARVGAPVELEALNVEALALVPGLGLVARHRGVWRVEPPRVEVSAAPCPFVYVCTCVGVCACVGVSVCRVPTLSPTCTSGCQPVVMLWRWAGLFLCASRLWYSRPQVYVSPDWVAMAAMSQVRVAWMCSVARAEAAVSPMPGPAPGKAPKMH
jgi:hypothetical protein